MARVKLSEVAREHKETLSSDKVNLRSVGLEHLISEEIRLKLWNENQSNTFSKVFRTGHILFGRRRAYLKKAAIASFDGFCSGDIIVIEAIKDKIISELLPFIIQNDDLFNYAMSKSAGSLSPRVKWSQLKEYEFNLPTLSEQKHLSKLLWAANDVKEAYQKLIGLTDELVKALFIEMFGSLNNKEGLFETVTLGEISKIISGGTPTRKQPKFFKGTIPWITTAALGALFIGHYNAMEYITREAIENSATKLIPANSLLFGIRVGVGKSSINTVDMCTNQDIMAITDIDVTRYDLIYIKKILEFNLDYFDSLKRGTTIKGITAETLKRIKIPLAPISDQKNFADMVVQSDKLRKDLYETLAALNGYVIGLMQTSLK